MKDRLEVRPLRHPALGTVAVPGSKSITNRAFVLAALSEGTCEVWRPLHSEDTEVMTSALRQLGFAVSDLGYAVVISRANQNRPIPALQGDLFVGNSGTTMRFLTAMVSLGAGRYRLDGVARMRERPIGDLVDALQQLGVVATCERGNGCPPVIIETDCWKGTRARIKGDVSSQFLSGLLMAAPLAPHDVTIEVEGPLVSWPYVAMTTEMIKDFGGRIDIHGRSLFHIPGRQRYSRTVYQIEADASAASYFFAAAAITRGRVCVEGLGANSLQGDIRFAALLKTMGCQVEVSEQSDGRYFCIRGGPLRGIDVDMNDISDTVMTLGAVALFADGPTTIRNVAHIRHKETDRLAALAAELRRVGAEVEEFADGLRITPRALHGAEVETYNDHRMAMSMALVGLKVPGVVIKDPGCVAKTYPDFFSDLEKLREAAPPR
jgi:3-phosphoshikimate 1-carboxyvinyltransferase